MIIQLLVNANRRNGYWNGIVWRIIRELSSLDGTDFENFVILDFISVHLFCFRLIENKDSSSLGNPGGLQFLHGAVFHLHLKVVFEDTSKCFRFRPVRVRERDFARRIIGGHNFASPGISRISWRVVTVGSTSMLPENGETECH